MTSPTWLIAEREFRTYVATLSFWAALLIGPLAAGGGLMAVKSMSTPAQPIAVEVVSSDAGLAHEAQVAVAEAFGLEGHSVRFTDFGARMTVAMHEPGVINLDFAPGFPLSAAGRALIARTFERNAARRATTTIPLTVHQTVHRHASSLSHSRDSAAVARFLSMTMLWLTLTGSLGMLLQTVVRERATRSLESLLSAVAPWQIMAGKLAGVGGVSLLVLTSWLGSVAAMALFGPTGGLAPAVFAELEKPELLVRVAAIYLLAFAFYGSVTVAVGAMARDSASAQNLSRPMFILLVVAFFIALTSAFGAAVVPSWFLYFPAFTPFLLLLRPANELPALTQLLVFIELACSSLLAAYFAACQFSLRGKGISLLAKTS